MYQDGDFPDLATSEGQDRFVDQVMTWDCLTRKGGPVDTDDVMRRRVPVFRNGTALMVQQDRLNIEVRSFLERIGRQGFEVHRVISVPPALLARITARLDLHSRERPRTLNLDRQKTLARLIEAAAEAGASDIHIRVLTTHSEVKLRVNGRMEMLESLGDSEGQEVIRAAMTVSSGTGASGTDSTFQQGALMGASGLLPPQVEMLRLQYTPTSGQCGALVMRLKYIGKAGDHDVDSLGYSDAHVEDLRVMRRKTNGMYIFAGKVSSGKTTTLQRCLNAMYMEKRGEISIYAAEDPRELELPGAIQAQINAGKDSVAMFQDAMKSALRSDPNVIVLGEIRTPELADMAVEAAKTGHALWSTVHAGSALGILNRLVNLDVDTQDLRDPKTVGGLVYQRLLGTICTRCRRTLAKAQRDDAIDSRLVARFVRLTGLHPEDLMVRGPGCPHCRSGLTGRTVVAEVIRPDARLLDLYFSESRMQAHDYWVKSREAGGLGGKPVLHHALVKAGAGLCDLDEIEEEVDLVETYLSDYGHLAAALRQEIAILRRKIGEPSARPYTGHFGQPMRTGS